VRLAFAFVLDLVIVLVLKSLHLLVHRKDCNNRFTNSMFLYNTNI
jgi:hypothetical protein